MREQKAESKEKFRVMQHYVRENYPLFLALHYCFQGHKSASFPKETLLAFHYASILSVSRSDDRGEEIQKAKKDC
jgi:hypothetical protein